MEKIYSTPKSALSSAENSNNVQLYKASGIGVATFFGTPIAGGFLLSRNYRNLGDSTKARKAIVLSVIGTICLFILVLLIPDDWSIPHAVFTVPQIFVMVQCHWDMA